MSAPTLTKPAVVEALAAENQPARRCNVVIGEEVCVPGWVNDLESYRRWAYSDEFPEHGWISYLNGEIWVDLSMEELFTHNQVKTEYTVALGGLVWSRPAGLLRL